MKIIVNGEVAQIPTGGGAVSSIPTGGIIMWSGTDVPDGWALCNGENGTPDLRGRFVLGVSEAHTMGETGGEEKVTLTVEQMPNHRHAETATNPSGEIKQQTYRAASSAYGGLYNPITDKSGDQNYLIYTGYVGNSYPHNNMPPYYTLAYIMKL